MHYTDTCFHVIKVTCNKNISESEGHGCREWIGGKIEVQKCRHNFPKFPVPETTILRKYSETEKMDGTKIKTAKENLDKITKFILRQTEDDLKEFEKLTFKEFLIELGLNNEQYIMALRGTVKQSFMFLPKSVKMSL